MYSNEMRAASGNDFLSSYASPILKDTSAVVARIRREVGLALDAPSDTMNRHCDVDVGRHRCRNIEKLDAAVLGRGRGGPTVILGGEERTRRFVTFIALGVASDGRVEGFD